LKRALDFGRADLDASEVHGVVRSSVRAPIASGQRLQLIAVSPQDLACRTTRAIGVIGLIVVAIEQAVGQAD